MNLFVTGGTGFFGKALLRYWQNDHPNFDKIYLLSRLPDAFLEKYSDLVEGLPIEFIKGDILNLSENSLDMKFDVVLHAATDSTKGPCLDRLEVYQQITLGTEEVLKFAINHSCQKFILTSSGGVYGAQPYNLEKIPEDYLGMPDPLDPNSAYGIGKRAAEHLTALYADKYGFDYVIARCFAFIGEDLPLDKHFAVGNFILDAINNNDIIIKGNGTSERSYMAQEDLAYVINQMMENELLEKVYNIGSDEPITILNLARCVKEMISGKNNIVIKNDNTLKGETKYIPDVSLMRRDIMKKEIISLKDSIKNTVDKI